jgi:hypothetical protein
MMHPRSLVPGLVQGLCCPLALSLRRGIADGLAVCAACVSPGSLLALCSLSLLCASSAVTFWVDATAMPFPIQIDYGMSALLGMNGMSALGFTPPLIASFSQQAKPIVCHDRPS